ncbi:hypothetical protein [Devosia sp. Leaf64]|uniref:hypothetical protein n=1 Tax=Devosia sp. Leaf64 TaxID=1736229 RepID=UPI000714178E|nr:hypothetical protein [Devosia sp. Leaf64]KQN77505.1 hypothetical protein ASE94_16000 [Devosia sp. Leaf64]
MTSVNILEFTPADLVTIDGVAHRYLGQSQDGLIFAPVGDERSHLTEILNSQIMAMLTQPGRLSIDREHFKRGRRK